MKTQWEHPKTGKKKRCAGGLPIQNLITCFSGVFLSARGSLKAALCALQSAALVLQPSDLTLDLLKVVQKWYTNIYVDRKK